MDNIKFGKFIQELRKEKNMTQKELAEKLNLTDKAISKWERDLSFPDIAMLKPLSEIFNVSIIELLNGQKENVKEIDLDSRILAILKQKEYEKNKKVRKVIGISAIIIIVFAIVFYIMMWSKAELKTWNPIRAVIGYVQVMNLGKEYIEVGNIPTKTIYANGNFDIEDYMNERGYENIGDLGIKTGDNFYIKGEKSVLVGKYYRRGILVYEWHKEEYCSRERIEQLKEKYEEIKKQDNIKKEYEIQNTNEIQNSKVEEIPVNLNIIMSITNSIE